MAPPSPPHQTRRNFVRRPIHPGLLALLLVGCSGSTDDPDDNSSPTTSTGASTGSSTSSAAPTTATGTDSTASQVTQHLTTADRAHLFSEVTDEVRPFDTALTLSVEIDPTQTRQEIVGFGFALTGGSAQHLHDMTAPARAALLDELFSTADGGISMSFLRVSVGASDLDATAFSYNEDASDPTHTGFSLGPHADHLVPMLQEILTVAPDMAIMASPWSAPSWMKDSGSFIGGSLLPEHQASYAAYLATYLQAMASEGIDITHLTVQNEPLHDGNNPSMTMEAVDQADFVENHLGPTLASNGHGTAIVAYDHNADRADYPISVLSDAGAAPYLDGAAFHLYGGSIDALTTVHNAHPDKHIYFTEQWYSADGDFMGDFHWHMRNVVIGSMRNWSRGVIEWNLSSNATLTPHTAGGCTRCLGAVTIDGDSITRNAGYYAIAHASRYVQPGSVYLHTEEVEGLLQAAFSTPDGNRVLLVMNDSDAAVAFNVTDGEMAFSTALDTGATATYVWAAAPSSR